MLATEHLCWPSDIYCGHWIDGQILADGGTLGKRKPWDSGKFGWSRFDQDVVGVRRWRVRCGLPTIRTERRLVVAVPLAWSRGFRVCDHTTMTRTIRSGLVLEN